MSQLSIEENQLYLEMEDSLQQHEDIQSSGLELLHSRNNRVLVQDATALVYKTKEKAQKVGIVKALH